VSGEWSGSERVREYHQQHQQHQPWGPEPWPTAPWPGRSSGEILQWPLTEGCTVGVRVIETKFERLSRTPGTVSTGRRPSLQTSLYPCPGIPGPSTGWRLSTFQLGPP
jgi:hypothetical protein